MIEKLNGIVEEISSMNSKLILLIGPTKSGKSNLLARLAALRKMPVLTLGSDLGRELLTVPSTRRHLQVAELLNVVADRFVSEGLLLIDNIELLFDRRLKLSPLDLLKRQAQARRVVAVWPGELRDNRLLYAVTGHPEHQDYGTYGVVPCEIH